MEIHQILGPGLLEVVYKDAMELEFKHHGIPYEREKKFEINYKGVILKHNFYADFVAFDHIILEIKACSALNEDHIKQSLNYISLAKSPLALLINFGAKSLEKKRVINT